MLECLHKGSVAGQGVTRGEQTGLPLCSQLSLTRPGNQRIKEPVPRPHSFSIYELRTTASSLSLFAAEESGDNICNSDWKNTKQLSQT